MREPRRDFREPQQGFAKWGRSGRCDFERRDQLVPVRDAKRLRIALRNQMPLDPQSHSTGGGGDDTYIRLLAGLAVQEQQFVCADAFELRAGERGEPEAALRESAADIVVRR